jgi:hypothetical protein
MAAFNSTSISGIASAWAIFGGCVKIGPFAHGSPSEQSMDYEYDVRDLLYLASAGKDSDARSLLHDRSPR